MCGARNFSSAGLNLSGPVAFCGFSSCRSERTPLSSIIRVALSVSVGICEMVGVFPLSITKTEENESAKPLAVPVWSWGS